MNRSMNTPTAIYLLILSGVRLFWKYSQCRCGVNHIKNVLCNLVLSIERKNNHKCNTNQKHIEMSYFLLAPRDLTNLFSFKLYSSCLHVCLEYDLIFKL